MSTAYLPWIGTAVAVGYAVYLTLKSRSQCKSQSNVCVNQCVQKESDKVVDSFDIEDMANKTVFCRCWRSKKVSNAVFDEQPNLFLLMSDHLFNDSIIV